ncbi:MAG: DUF5678 domain-containing protein [Chloroflexota bacterium]
MTVAERPKTEEQQIAPELQEKLIAHPGKWAALTRTEILAIEDSPTKAYQAARKLGVETPILYLVPDNRERTYYY